MVGSCAGTLYALDKHSGEVRWSYDVRQDGAREFHGDPAVAGDTVVIGSDGSDVGGLYAFNLHTGDPRWQHLITTGPPEGVGYTTDLLRSDSSVIAGAFGDTLESFDRSTGLMQWQFRSGFGQQRRVFPASPVLIGSTVFFGGQDGVLYALNAKDGTVQWKRDWRSRISTSVATDGSSIYLGTEDKRFYRIDPASGETIDSVELPSFGVFKPLITQDAAYVLAREKQLVALDSKLDTIWSREEPAGWSSPRLLIWKGWLVAGTEDGRLLAMDPHNGSIRWSHQLSGGAVRGIGADHDSIYAGTIQGVVFAVRLR